MRGRRAKNFENAPIFGACRYRRGRLHGRAADLGGVEVAAAAYRQLAASDFSVLKTEARVSVKELALEGKTDRIDTSDAYVRVIDYKTGRSKIPRPPIIRAGSCSSNCI